MKRLTTEIKEIYWETHASSRAWVKRFVAPLTQELLDASSFARNGWRVPVFWMEGASAANPAQRLRVAALASREITKYFASILFAGGKATTVEARGSCFSWQAKAAAQALAGEADLVVLERSTLLKWLPRKGEWMAAPKHVQMVSDFAPGETWEQRRAKLKMQQHNLSLIQREGFTYRISHDEADFNLFYDCIYSPSITQRHVDFPTYETRETLHKDFMHGLLLLVSEPGGKTVAASLVRIRGKTMSGVVNGVLDGRSDYVRRGALSATYQFCIQYCLENGFWRLDGGPSFPFQKDGGFKHKRYWAFEPSCDLKAHTEWLFWAPAASPAALEWMAQHLFVKAVAKWQGAHLDRAYQE